MIWFLTFGKNGSAGMPAVPATILMSAVCVWSGVFELTSLATRLAAP